MSIHDLIKNAKSVEIFPEIPLKEKTEITLKGKLAAAIINYRYKHDMTQTEFAKFMDISQSMVSKWESGEYNFSFDSVEPIISKLGLELELLQKRYSENSLNTEYRAYTSSGLNYSQNYISLAPMPYASYSYCVGSTSNNIYA